ncbi:hypothetical protein ASPACDRAFT_119792 [Aspergillus aculeatus ATCC 16872]|uniref:Cytochrome P450 monooxygenase aneG n=1 Tax=Aspergillus aculeatus (strain ATCC 16872 / CBS 172.66 / WB 5094) TaxID=690307 RepID=ANEG_ASPA1|nr:uncharacterized protein ASPACDRAFT_119792 [Aspergillus aculeatus ATCC 16872]A0A1L9WUV2.1 RecName: Full=Cytochrome P450 monooxygenase aneG; AltName: Full=Aculenes biosynthesis cluster protein G [Aspergillus aculeatus ATCC 16872]OJJ99918.1 hypothetical protein ASPACDRAFT_119792 [Aspergillus aculeatus ATCC 16872]
MNATAQALVLPFITQVTRAVSLSENVKVLGGIPFAEDGTYLEWLSILGFTIGCYYVIYTFYALCFHPLRKYPGPWHLAVSNIPNRWSTISGNSSYWLYDLHEKYGPIVRVAPNEISYSDPQAWQDIYGPQPNQRLGMPKDPKFFSSFEDKKTAASIITSQPKDYMRMRHIYSYGFSKQVMLAKEEMIQGIIDRAMEALRQTKQQPQDIVQIFRATDFSIVTEIVFGKAYHIFDRPTYQPWFKSLMGWIRSTAVITATTDYPLGKLAAWLLTPRSVLKQRNVYLKYVNGEIEERIGESNAGRKDVVQLMFETTDQPKLAESDIRANLPFMVIAASETTTTLMSGMIAHLLNSPDALSQLTAEVRGRFRSPSDITIATVNNLPFLNACVNEALRVYPAAPTQLPRVVPGEGATVCNRWVPGGTKVYVAPYATFRSAENFYQPDAFLPQRWLPENGESFDVDKKNAWRPFGLGAHECPGQVITNLITRLIMCKLLLSFDLELCADSQDWLSRQPVWIVWDKPELLIKARPAAA